MAPKDTTNETGKTEFGTGLRAQLEKRREDPEAAQVDELRPNVEVRFEVRARPAVEGEPVTVVSDVATEDLRRELANRESALTSQEGLTESAAKRQERREKRLASMEETIRDRIRELDER